MKKVIILFILLITIITCVNKNVGKQKTYEEINIKGEVIVNLSGGLHGITMDNKNNLYIGKRKEIIKVNLGGTMTPFAILEGTYNPENSKTYIYDLEYNNSDKCLYAASHDRVLKITPDGKMTTYIKENFPGQYGAVGIDFDDEGNMYIACANKIFKYTKELQKTLFLDGDKSKRIKIEKILGLEFDSTFKNLYFCESANGKLVKASIKNDKLVKLKVVFTDYNYSPEYVTIVDDNTFIIKDPAFKYFYFIQKKKVKRIVVDNVKQKYVGIETIIYRDMILYGTNYNGQTVYKINLSGVVNIEIKDSY